MDIIDDDFFETVVIGKSEESLASLRSRTSLVGDPRIEEANMVVRFVEPIFPEAFSIADLPAIRFEFVDDFRNPCRFAKSIETPT